MTDYERRDWTEALAILMKALAKIDEALLLYSADADDRDFRFLISKAIRLRDAIAEIRRMLNEEES